MGEVGKGATTRIQRVLNLDNNTLLKLRNEVVKLDILSYRNTFPYNTPSTQGSVHFSNKCQNHVRIYVKCKNDIKIKIKIFKTGT